MALARRAPSAAGDPYFPLKAFLLYDLNRIITGGETNYIHATVTLYVSIYNMFTSLLHLLGVAADD